MPLPRPLKIFRFAKFNLQALLSLAKELRGQSCACDENETPKSGSFNWAIFITFDDGVQWVFRSPRYDTSMYTKETASKMLLSEASTLKYLDTHCSIPVPKVYAYSETNDNDIGVPYILQSKATGRPLLDYCWIDDSVQPPGFTSPFAQLPLSESGRLQIMSQLGAIMSRLSRVHFDEIGSLFEDKDGNFSVGECLSPVLTWQSRDSVDAEINRGPFTQEDCYLGSLISALTTHAEELPLTPYLFFSPLPEQSDYPSWDSFKAAVDRRGDFVFVGGKLESSKNRLSYFIAGQILEEMVPLLLSRTTHFTLSHPDLHVGNIFVDDELNITGIIDWGSATTGPITELLATPGLAGPSNPPAPCLTASFQAGFCQESGAVERDLWGRAEMMWSFSRLVRLLSDQDLNLFSALYELVYNKRGDASSDTINYGRLFHERAMLETNKQLLSKLGEDDLTDEELREMERASFPPEKSDRLAVARKLTLMSEMNPGFVGDRRLWRWLEDSLQDDL